MGKKKKKKSGAAFNKKNLKQEILSVFYDNPQRTFNYKQLAQALSIKDPEIVRLISVVLDELGESGKIDQVQRGRFRLRTRGGYITGRVELQPQGFAYVNSEEAEEPVLVSQGNLNHAMEGDLVKVYLYARRKRHQLEGEVEEILERAKSTFVGVIERSRNFAFLIPVGKTGFDLFIPLEKLNGAKNGQKVVGRITEWPAKARNPFGEVIEILGNVGENETEMHAILAEYDLPLRFPEKVLKAAEKIPVDIPRKEIEKRRDMRDVVTFTIDPDDARDFDDALSLRRLEDGTWEIGVHIADVSYYVQSDSFLDEEAYNRATSVYLVDRVVPMLPEKLSNELCSLRPDEDKLCFSAVFKMNEEARITDQWFGRTIIHSNRRFTYDEVQQIIETKEGDYSDEVLRLNGLAQLMRQKRFRLGSISFERTEVKFRLDEQGKPLSVYFKDAKESNMLVEEFMLLANKKVAEFIGKVPARKQPKTFVYRIHDKPDPDKLQNFNHFIKKFGYDIHMTTPKVISKSLNDLMEKIKGKTEQNVIESLAIRSMAKAEYSTRNIGHYGLGFEYYTHFTSPIRRYPDVMVHRLLDRYLQGGRSANAQKYEDHCKHSTDMEIRAASAERSSVKYKQVEFMKDKIGEIFSGVISGITDWGIYVELEENKCEGMVSIRDLDDDFYIFDEKNYCLTGRHTKKTYQFGEAVKVEIVRANLERKQLDFKLVAS
ncbi:MAG: ribonuclease R [Mangrovibacterium sp.]